MADLPFISKSDLEILQALRAATELGKKYYSNSTQTSSDMQATESSSDVFTSCSSTSSSISDDIDFQTVSTFESASDVQALPAATELNKKYCSNSMQTSSNMQATRSSDVFTSCSPTFESTSDDFLSDYSLFEFDSVYETVQHDINCINKMCDLFIEKNKHLEMQIFSFLKDASSNHQEIISPEYLCEMLERTNNTVEHIVLISDKMYKIQQFLREKRYERTLRVNPSCQKTVLKFFTTANEIMNKLQEQVKNVENYSLENSTEIGTLHEELQSNLHNRTLELAKRLDIISQFRDQLFQATTQSSVSKSEKESESD